MKILVLSDSHSALSFMRRCVQAVKPDALIHLGDHFDDGQAIAEENPKLPVHQVPGNCDRYRMVRYHPEVLCYEVCGVKLFMTHGHNHHVKLGNAALVKQAREMEAQAALYGHTHVAHCTKEADGLWVLNPGSCGSYGGSAGFMLVEDGKIIECKILRSEDLEEFL